LVRRAIVPVAATLLFSAGCASDGLAPDSSLRDIMVWYKVTWLAGTDTSARISYATPGGRQVVDVDRLPWESDRYPFSPGRQVRLVVSVPRVDPSGNLQCEIVTDEPGTAFQSVPVRRCVVSGRLPFVSAE
jgi:hypothetical protein